MFVKQPSLEVVQESHLSDTLTCYTTLNKPNKQQENR